MPREPCAWMKAGGSRGRSSQQSADQGCEPHMRMNAALCAVPSEGRKGHGTNHGEGPLHQHEQREHAVNPRVQLAHVIVEELLVTANGSPARIDRCGSCLVHISNSKRLRCG